MHPRIKRIKFLKPNITKVNAEWRRSPTHNNSFLFKLVYLPFQIESLTDVFPLTIAATHIPEILTQKAIQIKPYFAEQTQEFFNALVSLRFICTEMKS